MFGILFYYTLKTSDRPNRRKSQTTMEWGNRPQQMPKNIEYIQSVEWEITAVNARKWERQTEQQQK